VKAVDFFISAAISLHTQEKEEYYAR